MNIIFIAFLLILATCSGRPSRYFEGAKLPGASNANPDTGSTSGPTEAELDDSVDTYLSIGTFLQKELDKTDNSGKFVKIFVLMRQDNLVPKNFDILKAAILPANPLLSEAIDLSKKNGFSTVEVEVEINSLRTTLGSINKAVSSMEISLGTAI